MSLLPLLILVTTVYRAGADTAIGLLDLSKCGSRDRYTECHVDAACLYGSKKKREETPIFLHRYYVEYHGKIDVKNCFTLIFVRATRPADDRYPREVRSFKASGWIDPVHFTIGVRFLVGQKLVLLDAYDGFTDDDDWVYGSKHTFGHEGVFPVFNGTLVKTEKDGKIRVSLDAKAHEGKRQSHYDRPYLSQAQKAGKVKSDALPSARTTTPLNKRASDAAKPAAVAAAESEKGTAAESQKQAAAADDDAAPATAGTPVLMIVLCVVGAIIVCLLLAGAGFAWVKRKNRKANKLKTERTQETETLIVNPETDKPAVSAPNET